MRQYIIIDVSELDNLYFDELATTSKETARRSLDGTNAIVSFDETPPYFAFSTTYTNDELLELINNNDWNEQEEE